MKPRLQPPHPRIGSVRPRGTGLRRNSSLTGSLVVACLVLAACSAPADDGAIGEPDRAAATADELRADAQDQEQDREQDREQVTRPRRIADLDDIPEVVATELTEPETFVPEAIDELRATVEEAMENPDVAIFDVAGLADEGPTAAEIASFGDGNTRSGAGELVVLDEAASLACANTEIAIQHLDEGDQDAAIERVATAAEWAASADNRVFPLWAEELDRASTVIDGEASVDPVPLIGLFAACLDGGYDI